jgi:hypothetical protein
VALVTIKPIKFFAFPALIANEKLLTIATRKIRAGERGNTKAGAIQLLCLIFH